MWWASRGLDCRMRGLLAIHTQGFQSVAGSIPAQRPHQRMKIEHIAAVAWNAKQGCALAMRLQSDQGRPGTLGMDLLQEAGQLSDRRIAEQGLQRQLGGKGIFDAGRQPDGQQGVAAKLEEIVENASLRVLQYRAPDGQQILLGDATRMARRCTRHCLGRLGQSLAIDLASRCQWQAIQQDESAGDHPARQMRTQVIA